MSAMRNLAAAIGLALLGPAALGALDIDFGGTIDNYSSLPVTVAPASTIYAPDQRDKAGIWMELHASPAFSLSAAGSYNYTLQVPYLFNVDYLKADWRIIPQLDATFGRFVFTDFSGHVLNHTLDGALVTLELPVARISAAAGYSGLEFKPLSLILMSRSDNADQTNSSVYLAAPRLIEKLEVLFPSLFTRVDLNISVILQQDLRSSSQLIQAGEQNQVVSGLNGGSLTTEYFGLGLSGPIVSSFYYSAFFYWNAGSTLSYLADSGSTTGFSYQYAPIHAWIGGIGLRYYSEEALASRVEFQAIVSSGDSDSTSYLEGNTAGASATFVPISQEVIGLAFTPQFGNLILVDASYSFKPLANSETVWRNLQLMAKVFAFFRPTTGAISQPGLSSGSGDFYLGTEPDIVVSFRPFGELGVVVSTGVFFPNTNAFSGSAASPTVVGRIEFSMSF